MAQWRIFCFEVEKSQILTCDLMQTAYSRWCRFYLPCVAFEKMHLVAVRGTRTATSLELNAALFYRGVERPPAWQHQELPGFRHWLTNPGVGGLSWGDLPSGVR